MKVIKKNPPSRTSTPSLKGGTRSFPLKKGVPEGWGICFLQTIQTI